MTSDALPAFVDAVREIVRHAAAAGPLPVGWPYLGLDHVGVASLDQLADLARHGIFRKYEEVLVLAGGLGAPARWAATRLGCTTVTTSADVVEAAAGGALTAEAGLGDAVRHVVGRDGRLPVRHAAVTHVWTIESLSGLADPGAALAEAWRVVRPGGHLAMLEAVAAEETITVAGRTLRPPAWWARRTSDAGFVDVAALRAPGDADQPTSRVLAARAQLASRMLRSRTAGLVRAAQRATALSDARAAGRVRLMQLCGRRP
jgi:SAM-dependent methyltransferase